MAAIRLCRKVGFLGFLFLKVIRGGGLRELNGL